MNIHKIAKKCRRQINRYRRRRNERRRYEHRKYGSRSRFTYREHNIIIYAGFICAVSLICVLAANILGGSNLRNWYYTLTHKETINKGVDDMEDEGGSIAAGQFLTHYRFQIFGATNPGEVDPNAPMVAFTFDDGPSSESTQRILDVLSANYSHATFFVVGRQTEQFPEVLQAIRAAGCEIGNHTFDHKNLTELSIEQVEQQIDDVNRSVNKATGEDTTLIRPPYGAYDDEVMSVLSKPVILWDIDSEDWKSRNAQTVCEKVLDEVHDGDIVLMHDIYESSADAVELLVPKLKERGFQIVSVSEMAAYRGKTLELGKAYGKIESEIQDDPNSSDNPDN